MSWFRWLRPPSVRERPGPYNLRGDVLKAAAAMASDQRSDVHVARLGRLNESKPVRALSEISDARLQAGHPACRELTLLQTAVQEPRRLRHPRALSSAGH